MNTAEFLMIASSVVPDRTAMASDGQSRNFLEMQDRVNRLANALQAKGVGQGDKVAVMALNSMEYVEIYYAAAKLGAVFVPLNYRAKQEELAYMCNNSEASALFVGQRYLDLCAEIRPELKTVKHIIGIDTQAEGMDGYAALLAQHEPDEIFTDVQDLDPTIVIYTSGTTALPKGVVLTFLGMSVYVTNTVEPADPGAETVDVLLVSVPFYHVAGATTMLSSVWGGRKMVILSQFEPGAWLKAVEEHGVTHSFVVPTMLKRIMEHPDFEKTNLSSLKLVAYGAAPMPYEVVTKAVEKMHCGLMNAYGQTESTSSLTFLGPDDHQIPKEPGPERDRKLARLRSVGRTMDDITVGIMDPDGNILPSGQEGEIVAQGARIMSGYLNREEETSAAIQGGWLHTGDVGWIDEDGYLYITGRTKDLIIRGGENIAPGEIEGVLQQHSAVEDAAVIGVPDVEWGEEVKAIVVLKGGAQAAEDELAAFVKERLASFKVPRYFTFVDDLPRNYMGKVLKTDLRKQHGEAAAAPRRRESRRDRIDRRDQRIESGVAEQVTRPHRLPQGISYSGVCGGALAIAVLVAVAFAFATSEDKQGFGFVYGALVPAFVPAIWASVGETPLRNAILRASTGLALVVGLGSIVVDPGVPIVMVFPTVLLAQAAGLIFQGKRSST